MNAFKCFKPSFRCAAFRALALFFPAMTNAADAPSSAASSTRLAQTSASAATSTLERGRVLLSIHDPRALPMLRDVAQRALSQMRTQTPSQTSDASAEGALAACLWWGRAAQTFRARDESIQAWTQGLAVLRSVPNNSRNALSLSLERDLRSSLDTVLRAGFPLRASDQTLQTLSDDVARGAWKPLRSTFQFPAIEYSNQDLKPPNSSRELLVTSGNLSWSDNGGTLVGRTPSLYRSLDAAVPPTLRMNQTVFGYVRDGASWRQIVRVLYVANPETQLRAERTCLQFLRVWTMFNEALGRSNTYANDGVTTLWMTTEAAEWPQKPPENWSAGAWIDSSPDQMILFRVGQARPEAEWLREVAHEYSHIAWPPFAGFQTPLEPFGNGRLGETLLMLWAAQSPQAFFDDGEMAQAQRNCLVHVERHALPALQSWLGRDPRKVFSSTGDNLAFNQLLGLAIQIERVYGADVLRRALNNAARGGFARWREAGIEYSMRRTTTRKPVVLRTEDLMRGFQSAMNQSATKTWPSENWPIWLPGAIVAPHRSAAELAGRAPLKVKAGATVAAWIYVPADAKTLRVLVQSTSSGTAPLKVVGDWKATNARNALLISLAGRAGWQRLQLRAIGEISLTGARFERGASKPLS